MEVSKEDWLDLLAGTDAQLGYVDERWDGTTAVEEGIQILLYLPHDLEFYLEWRDGRYTANYTIQGEFYFATQTLDTAPVDAVLDAALWATVRFSCPT